jgi:aspartate aminotransferase
MLVLSTGDIRIPVYTSIECPLARFADQSYREPAGEPGVRRLIAEACAQEGCPVSESQVVITPGARQALFVALRVVLGQRDEVLVPSPYWTSYPELVAMAGGTPVPVPGRGGSGPALDALTTQVTPRTAAVIINSPRNPDGAVMPSAALHDIVEWSARADIVVLFDQVYRGVLLAERTATSITNLFPALPDHCVVIDGLSKSHALAGLRLGWAIAAERVSARIIAAASHLIGGTCSVAQDMALQALRNGEW